MNIRDVTSYVCSCRCLSVPTTESARMDGWTDIWLDGRLYLWTCLYTDVVGVSTSLSWIQFWT